MNCPLCEVLSVQVDALKQKNEELENQLEALKLENWRLIEPGKFGERELHLDGGMK